jgi:DNA-binding NarL/FixJ family response regulator
MSSSGRDRLAPLRVLKRSGRRPDTRRVEVEEVTSPDSIRVLVVDDHDLFRRGVRSLLDEHGLDVVGEAADGIEALRLATELLPDVVVMDLNLPGISGLEATWRLADAAPSTRVLVLTVSAEDGDVSEAVLAGASGYLLKDASDASIVDGVRSAAAGESLIAPRVVTKVLEQLRTATAHKPRDDDDDRVKLTPRELDVLRLVAEGKCNSDIARELFVSPQTVRIHVSSILAKLEIHNRIQAAVYAVRSGIV